MRSFGIAALGFCSALLLASIGQAASYGNFVGTNVTYQSVSDGLGLYGAPTISGNALDFSPTAYVASCPVAGCPPSPVIVDDALAFHIQANSGFIGSIILAEAGDTTLASFLNAFAATQVSAPVHIQIEVINGVPVSVSNPFVILKLDTFLTFNNGGLFQSTVDGTGTHLWNGSLSVDVDQMIALAGLTGRATRIDFSMDNVLTAYAESGASARIQKKDVDGLTITVVPEPGTGLLMALGLVGLAAIRRNTR